MDLLEAIQTRHSVRSYTSQEIEGKIKDELLSFLQECNRDSGLHMQLVLDEPKAFDSFIAHFGKFSGARNYIAVIGTKDSSVEETCGYYGEKVVLKAQQMGLNTCWAAMTYSKIKTAYELKKDEKIYMVIAIGYGENQGNPHKSKSASDVSNLSDSSPEWFRKGVEAALLAPTAMNQQKFYFTLHDDQTVSVKSGIGFYSRTDLGIVKYHFELGAGVENFHWHIDS